MSGDRKKTWPDNQVRTVWLLRALSVGRTCCCSPHGILPSSTGSRAEPFRCTQFAAGVQRACRGCAEAQFICNSRDCVCIGSRVLVNRESRIRCRFSQTLGPLTRQVHCKNFATDQFVIIFKIFSQLDQRRRTTPGTCSWLEIWFRLPGTILTFSNAGC